DTHTPFVSRKHRTPTCRCIQRYTLLYRHHYCHLWPARNANNPWLGNSNRSHRVTPRAGSLDIQYRLFCSPAQASAYSTLVAAYRVDYRSNAGRGTGAHFGSNYLPTRPADTVLYGFRSVVIWPWSGRNRHLVAIERRGFLLNRNPRLCSYLYQKLISFEYLTTAIFRSFFKNNLFRPRGA